MIRFLLSLLLLVQNPGLIGPGPGTVHSTGPQSGNYTGNSCSNGISGSFTAVPCSASMNVGGGDIVFVFGTIGDSASTLSNCATSAGTATVSWTVVTASSNIHDASNNETSGMCFGNVTGGGTLTPVMNWGVAGGDGSIIAADFTGLKNTVDGGGNGAAGTGSTATNGVTSGTITTTVNGDTLFGGTADTNGSAATVTAGTSSVAFTKIVCNTAWGGQTCIEWGNQTTAAAGTQAAWTFSAADRTLSGIIAMEHN